MPTRKQMDSVQDRIETLTEERFWASGEFLRPVGRDSPKAGTRWTELDFEDRREAVYVNVDWSGFTLEEQMEITDRVADGDIPELWMGDIRASDQREHDLALHAEMAEEQRTARAILSGADVFRTIMAAEAPVIEGIAEKREGGHER